MLEHVSLPLNKKWHSRVCTYGGYVLWMFDVCASGFARKFREHVSYKMDWWMTYVSVYLISLLHDEFYELPMNSDAKRMVMESEELMRLWKETRDS
jgi:hypothetical protein